MIRVVVMWAVMLIIVVLLVIRWWMLVRRMGVLVSWTRRHWWTTGAVTVGVAIGTRRPPTFMRRVMVPTRGFPWRSRRRRRGSLTSVRNWRRRSVRMVPIRRSRVRAGARRWGWTRMVVVEMMMGVVMMMIRRRGWLMMFNVPAV